MRKIQGREASVRSNAAGIESMSFVDTFGRPFGTIKPTGNPDQQSLMSEYEIFRGDSARILYNSSKDKDNVRYIFGEQIASMQQDGDENGPIKVEFANGLASAEYDLVIACDGATSRTRAMGLNIGVRVHIEPVNSWAAFFSIKEDLIQGSKEGLAHSAIGGRFIPLGGDPKGGNRVTWMSVNHRDISPFREAMRKGEEVLKFYIAQQYKGVGWKAQEAMEAMMTSTDFYANEMVQVKLPHLQKGRCVVVGDAGYAPGPTGTGTTLALTGAYILAGEIVKNKGNLTAGLQGYEDRMKPKIKDMQKIPPFALTFCAPQTAWGVWLRNNLFALLAWSNLVEYAQTYLGGAFSNTKDKYDLPDYDWVA